MDDAQLKEMIMRRQSSGRISCKEACAIADEAGVPRGKVGQLINELQIKIRACQLGCFK